MNQNKKDTEKWFGELHDLVKKLGRQPNSAEFSKATGHTVQRRFQSYRAFIEAAGYKYAFSRFNKSDLQAMRQDIEKVAQQLGRPPNQSEYKSIGSYHFSSVKRIMECRNWREVLQNIFGLDNHQARAAIQKTKRTDESRIEELKSLAKKLRHTPSIEEAVKYGIVTSVLRKSFGSWAKTLEAANLPKRPMKKRKLKDFESLSRRQKSRRRHELKHTDK